MSRKPESMSAARNKRASIIALLVSGAGVLALETWLFRVLHIRRHGPDFWVMMPGLLVVMIGLWILLCGLLMRVKGVEWKRMALGGLSVLAGGLSLFVPVFGPPALGQTGAALLFAGFIVLSMLPGWFLKGAGDERERRVRMEAAIVGQRVFYWLILLYAAFATMGYRLPIDLWGVVSLGVLVQALVAMGLVIRHNPPLPEEEPA